MIQVQIIKTAYNRKGNNVQDIILLLFLSSSVITVSFFRNFFNDFNLIDDVIYNTCHFYCEI